MKEYVASGQIKPGQALDIGSGKGRNSIYLAKLGYKVVGVEIVTEAIAAAYQIAVQSGVADKIRFIEQSAGAPLPVADASFDLIIDMMVMHLLDAQELALYATEVVRLLKPGGYLVFYTIAAESPAVQALFQSSPGPEPNSYVIPQSGVVEKAFTAAELAVMFTPLRVIRLEPNIEFTPAFGDVYERTYYAGLLQK